MKEQINQPKEKQETSESADTVPANLRQKKFDKVAFDRCWQDFLLRKEKEGKHSEVTILKASYELHNQEVTLPIANEALLSTFEKIKPELLNYLRDGLGNDRLMIKTKIVQMAREEMLYTDLEKFEHLKKKYPALQKLQDTLGLDPEF